MILSSFRISYPEFKGVPDPMVQAFLDTAAGRLDKSVWGSDYDQGHGLKTAALLANSPNGQGMARMSSQTVSIYQVEYDTLVRIVTQGMRVF